MAEHNQRNRALEKLPENLYILSNLSLLTEAVGNPVDIQADVCKTDLSREQIEPTSPSYQHDFILEVEQKMLVTSTTQAIQAVRESY